MAVSFQSARDEVPALPGRGWFSPEDGQVEIGEAVGVAPRDRAFDEHGCYFGVGMRVGGDLLRQRISPAAFFLH